MIMIISSFKLLLLHKDNTVITDINDGRSAFEMFIFIF